MSTCEKCWRDAHLGEFNPNVATNYAKLIKERKSNPCTPEEQAGPGAEKCLICGRKTLHQHTGECVIGCNLMKDDV